MAVRLFDAGAVDPDLPGFNLPPLDKLPRGPRITTAKPHTLRQYYRSPRAEQRLGKAVVTAYLEALDQDYIDMAWRGVGQLAAGLKRDLTPKEKRLVFTMIYYAAEWGFRDGARMSRGQKMAALEKATPSRKAKTDAKYQAVRDAFASAARGGGDVDVSAICRECRVSRATYYRAMNAKPAKRR